ncbi:hypothetical protein POM88_052344 [Heracleum sosnowskyi]|uniref:Uncharacterized protein n=1 Tax=Heracleum sosnowskyi TaxID=360622 RepID=A0AAD8LYT5_9APIA|nr:hypothetical protein POM88_052344 [Heracleum sosnowskyi]
MITDEEDSIFELARQCRNSDFFIIIISKIQKFLVACLNSITLIVCGGALTQAIVLLWLLLGYSTSTGLYGIVIPLIIAAIWGIGDGIFNTQLSALIALLFKHDMFFSESGIRYGLLGLRILLTQLSDEDLVNGRFICTTQALAECFNRDCLFRKPLHYIQFRCSLDVGDESGWAHAEAKGRRRKTKRKMSKPGRHSVAQSNSNYFDDPETMDTMPAVEQDKKLQKPLDVSCSCSKWSFCKTAKSCTRIRLAEQAILIQLHRRQKSHGEGMNMHGRGNYQVQVNFDAA